MNSASVTCTLLALAGVAFAAPTITNLGLLPGGTFSRGGYVSPDGLVVTGYADIHTDKIFGDQAFRWTQAGGMVNLGVPTGLPWTAANSINDNGSAVAGNAGNNAFRWTQSGGMQNLGQLPGGATSIAFDLSGDGSIVVGWSDATAGIFAFRWTNAGMQNLGTLPGGTGGSEAHGISQDGTRIVGSSSWSGAGARACLWHPGGLTNLGVLFGGANSFARAVSDNNQVITGHSGYVGDETAGDRAFRYANSVMMNLGVPPGAVHSYGDAINYDGSTIVGRARRPDNTYRACLWTAQVGMVDLNTYLPSLGLNLTGWVLNDVRGITIDGSAISGTGTFNGQDRAYLVRNVPCSLSPWNVVDPAPQSTCPFGTVFFQSSASSFLTTTVQWQREITPNSNNFVNLANGPTASWDGNAPGIGTVVSGANTPLMSLAADSANARRLAAVHAVRYRVVFTNNCGATTTAPAQLALCLADFDCDGFVTGLDFDAFVAAFEEGSWLADIDGDGFVTGIDFDRFVEAFEAGC